MSKLTSLIRRAPKRFSALVAILAAAIIVPVAVNAWGPSRDTFTIEKPAPYVTFNSITNNPVHGDERNFVQVKEAGASDSTYAENVSLKPGKQYTIFMYYHNNAATNLNASGKGIATGAYVKAQLPAVVNKGSTGTKANGYVGAANATPQQVWDDISFSNATAGDMAIRFVPGSAKIHNKGAINGSTLSDSIITSGATIGYNALDGKVPGCNEFSGYVTFNIQADQPNFELSKQVRLEGTTEWKETVEAQPGATVEYQLRYANTGTTRQNNVVLKDTLPTGISYVAGSTYLKNMNNTTPVKVSDNLVTNTGINIGDYMPGSVAYVKFSAKVSSKKEDFCKPTTLKNVARVETNNGSDTDDADVTVKPQDCVEPALYSCKSLTVTQVDRTKFKFETTTLSTANVSFKNVTYIIRDANGNEVERKTSTSKTLDYTQTKVGKYSVQAVVTFTVNGQDKTATSNECKKEFEVKKEIVPAYTCKALTVQRLSKNDFRFTTDYSVENATFKNIIYVIRDASGKEIDRKTVTGKTLDYKQMTPGKYSVQATVVVTVNGETKTVTSNDCKKEFEVPKTPEIVDIPVCDLTTKKVITIKENQFDASKHSKNLDDCKETPVVPPELPHTGASDGIVAVIGLGALIASIGYYVASRRSLGL